MRDRPSATLSTLIGACLLRCSAERNVTRGILLLTHAHTYDARTHTLAGAPAQGPRRCSGRALRLRPLSRLTALWWSAHMARDASTGATEDSSDESEVGTRAEATRGKARSADRDSSSSSSDDQGPSGSSSSSSGDEEAMSVDDSNASSDASDAPILKSTMC